MAQISGKDRLIEEVGALPASIVKDLLQERVLGYFTQKPPFAIQRGGLRFMVYNSGVDINTDPGSDVQGGKYECRTGDNLPAYQVDRATKVTTPLSSFILDSERRKYPKEHFAKDGSFLFDSIFPANGQKFRTGMAPRITIYYPDRTNSNIPPQFLDAGERFAFVKEACGLLVDDLRLDETYRKSTQLDLPTTVSARDDLGLISSVEIITPALNILNAQKGRFLAMQDLAGYFLAIKAFEGTDVIASLGSAQSIAQVLNSVRNVNISGSVEAVLEKTARWVLTNKDANKLPHMGNLQRIP